MENVSGFAPIILSRTDDCISEAGAGKSVIWCDDISIFVFVTEAHVIG
jgi:hypothetical protein